MWVFCVRLRLLTLHAAAPRRIRMSSWQNLWGLLFIAANNRKSYGENNASMANFAGERISLTDHHLTPCTVAGFNTSPHLPQHYLVI